MIELYALHFFLFPPPPPPFSLGRVGVGGRGCCCSSFVVVWKAAAVDNYFTLQHHVGVFVTWDLITPNLGFLSFPEYLSQTSPNTRGEEEKTNKQKQEYTLQYSQRFSLKVFGLYSDNRSSTGGTLNGG